MWVLPLIFAINYTEMNKLKFSYMEIQIKKIMSKMYSKFSSSS